MVTLTFQWAMKCTINWTNSSKQKTRDAKNKLNFTIRMLAMKATIFRVISEMIQLSKASKKPLISSSIISYWKMRHAKQIYLRCSSRNNMKGLNKPRISRTWARLVNLLWNQRRLYSQDSIKRTKANHSFKKWFFYNLK